MYAESRQIILLLSRVKGKRGFMKEDVTKLPQTNRKCSGKFIVRIPKYLHRRLVKQAEVEGVSLNQYVESLLSERSSLKQVIKSITDGLVTRLDEQAAKSAKGGISVGNVMLTQEIPYELYERIFRIAANKGGRWRGSKQSANKAIDTFVKAALIEFADREEKSSKQSTEETTAL
jgi:HicB family